MSSYTDRLYSWLKLYDFLYGGVFLDRGDERARLWTKVAAENPPAHVSTLNSAHSTINKFNQTRDG